jgi:RNA polymerase sigma factor (sigma-70 family)
MAGDRFDLSLIEAARSGEPAALERLLVEARPDLQRYALRSCFISDVDDAVQESLLILSRYLSTLQHARAWSRWMFRIVRRQCHRLARLALRQDLWDDDRSNALLAQRSDSELRVDVAAALESLPQTYLELVMLRDFEGLTIGEIADQLGLTPAAVKGRLHRARELVREYLCAQ